MSEGVKAMKNTGGPAFPYRYSIGTDETALVAEGMTLRDWFAGQALSGMVATGITVDMDGSMPFENRAGVCYLMADAMLAERSRGKS